MVIFNGSKTEKVKGLKKYFNYIETIRHNNVADKTTLKNLLGVAWPTLQNALEDFECEGSPILSKPNGFFLNDEFSIHAGISVGATQIKLYLCDFSFFPLKRNFYEKNDLLEVYDKLKKDEVNQQECSDFDEGFFCYKRESSVGGIASRLNKIFDSLIKIDVKTKKMLSVGISFPGIINKESLTIDFSPNIRCLRNVCVKDLLSADIWEKLHDNEIKVYYEHDTQAASIFEKESLYAMDEKRKKDFSSAKNVCCVYVAAGISASLILDNKLCRGSTNSFGEFAHTPAPALILESISNTKLSEKEVLDKLFFDIEAKEDVDWKNVDKIKRKEKPIVECECGKIACLESAFRRNVFNSYNLDEYLDTINNKGVLKKFNEIHPYRYRVLKEYIGYMVGLLINFFNPDLIIFSGRIMWEIEQLYNDLYTVRADSAIGIPASNCDIILGTKKIYSAAAGSAISSYHCCIPDENFCEITW